MVKLLALILAVLDLLTGVAARRRAMPSLEWRLVRPMQLNELPPASIVRDAAGQIWRHSTHPGNWHRIDVPVAIILPSGHLPLPVEVVRFGESVTAT